MLEPKSVTVNGRNYTVNPFTPGQAFVFLHELALAKATGRGLTELGKVALNKCYDAAGNALSEKTHFKTVFTEHPEDLMDLEAVAIETLTAPFESKPEGDKDESKA